MINWSTIVQHINSANQIDDQYQSVKSVSGGDINEAYLLTTKQQHHYFIKLNNSTMLDMFVAEFEALIELQKCKSIRTPVPICTNQIEHQSYIAMEYLHLTRQGNDYQFGKALAQMHKITKNKYGWHRNNTIGSTLQTNKLNNSWIEFWKQQRLIPQFEMLYQKGYRTQLKPYADKLLDELERFFDNHTPNASLLHGDLWSGNYAFNNSSLKHKGSAIIFDPALYYGDRETDLAMTELFGGFSQNFYAGYQDHYPLADNYKKRKAMYNLYHILNHANLFGSGYLNQAIAIMNSL